MKLQMAEICKFAQCTVSSRNYVEGEKVLNSKHVLTCGKLNVTSENIQIIAYCLQTSDLRGTPHEISGQISGNGTIINFKCSCKAGLSEKCKHVLAVLLHCNRFDTNDFEVFSCTDVKCTWKQSQNKTLEQYQATKVESHECYSKLYRDCNVIDLSDVQINKIKKLIRESGDNALTKHINGRHDVVDINKNNEIVSEDVEIIRSIVCNEESDVMKNLCKIKVNPMRDCCYNKIVKLYEDDILLACIHTENSVGEWLKVRQFRITGSRIYKIYTYCSNKNPDWEKKSLQYFYPKTFQNKFTKHGKKYEPVAIAEYEQFVEKKVITCGAVISKSNAWLSYSPDGIVMEDGKPSILIEVKCPYAGKENNIMTVLPSIKYLKFDGETVIFNRKHDYYCQIQMGMAVLNVPSTDFIIFASFDSSFIIVNVLFDTDYITNVLTEVKKVFFNIMLHFLCIEETNCNNNGSTKENK